MNKVSETNSILEGLKNEILEWDSSELLQIIVIAGSLPQNNVKIPRLETLFRLIISLPENEFKKNKFDMKSLETILAKLDQICSWEYIEDYYPISVLEYPGVWILGKRYRIFPGSNDRAYEYWKDLIRHYFDLRQEYVVRFNYDPVVIIQQILSLQTKLVEVIEKNHTSCKIINELYLPTKGIISQWQEIIQEWKKESNLKFFEKYEICCGDIEFKKNFEIEPIENIYKFFSISNNTSIIFPHAFHDFLSTEFIKNQNKIKKEIQEKIIKNSKYYLYKKLQKFFPKIEIIFEFSLEDLERMDFAVFFDNNKLFVFKIIHLDFVNNVQSTCNTLFDNFEKMEQKISDGETTFYYKDRKAGNLPHNKIEIIPIVLFYTIKVSEGFKLPEHRYLNTKNLWCSFYIDFLSILDELDDFMRFLKFLRRKNALQKRVTVQTFSNLDLFAHYLQNNDSFWDRGQIPHMISFLPGFWDKFKVDQIKQRPDFQARYEESEEDDFWEIKVLDKSLFFVWNIFGMAANVFLLPSKRDIWIMAMNQNIQYDENEVHCISSLTELIPHRFVNNGILDELFEHLSISDDITIHFSLMSTKMINKQNIEPMKQFLSLITPQSPITVKHFVSPEGVVIFYFIYSSEDFLSFLNDKPLEGEKYVLEQLLNEMGNYAKIENVEKIITQYLSKLFKDAFAAFSFTKISIPIFTPTSQTDFPHTLQSDRSEITRMTAEFLTTLNISPDVYDKKNAKEILNKIYKFLNSKFIARISKINQTALLSFLQHSEGQIIKARLLHQKRSRHELQFTMEHDPIERFSENNAELIILGEVYRYAIEIAIKFWSDNSEPFILEEWLELQAMAEQILACAFDSSYLFFRLGEYQFHIFDDYSFRVEQKNTFALKNFGAAFDKLFVTSEKPTVNYTTRESLKKFSDDLDEPFEDEFDITFKKLCNVIDICLFYLKEKRIEMKLISIDELYAFSITIYPEISREQLISGLDVLSLTKENMNYDFYPSDVRNRQFRHGCKPIIKFTDNSHYLINAWSIENVTKRMLYEIDQGYLLYNDNFIGSKLSIYLRQLREKANRHHEKSVYEVIKTKSTFIELNIKKENQIFSGIDEKLPGEIDTLAIFSHTKTIWLIESKNIKMNFAARDISNEMQKFVRSNGYVDKFIRKIEFVKKYLSKILAYYEISDNNGWNINNYFVTSNVSFLKQYSTQFEFITLIDLQKMISKIS